MDLKACLAQGYSQSAPAYDAVAGPLYLSGLHRLLPWVRVVANPAVLDLGCGTGLNLLETARVLGPCRLLVGADISPGMVDIAQSKARALGIPAAFHVADAESLPYADRTFDLIICNSVYHWFRDRRRALGEAARVLSPGGQLLLICAAQPGFHEWFRLLETVLRQVLGGGAPPTFPDLPDAAELRGNLDASGLQVEHLRHTIHPMKIKDPSSFMFLMDTVAPHWHAYLPPEVRGTVQQILNQYMRTHFRRGFPCTWAALEAVALRPFC